MRRLATVAAAAGSGLTMLTTAACYGAAVIEPDPYCWHLPDGGVGFQNAFDDPDGGVCEPCPAIDTPVVAGARVCVAGAYEIADAGSVDAGAADAGNTDAGEMDSGNTDAG